MLPLSNVPRSSWLDLIGHLVIIGVGVATLLFLLANRVRIEENGKRLERIEALLLRGDVR